jgi:pre-mRNA-processing factor SLU7
VGEGEVQLDDERLARALKEEKKRKMRGDDDGRSGKRAKGDETHEVTEEQLGKRLPNHAFVRGLIAIVEAYRMTRNRMEDPMANYVDAEV